MDNYIYFDSGITRRDYTETQHRVAGTKGVIWGLPLGAISAKMNERDELRLFGQWFGGFTVFGEGLDDFVCGLKLILGLFGTLNF